MNKFLFRAAIGLLMAFFGAITYFSSNVENPVTGEKQRVQLSQRQEVVLGLQARDKMAAQYGGLYPSQSIQQYVDRVGKKVVNGSDAKKAGYPFQFYLLRDPKTVNAFALPGGPVFITAGLLRRLNSEAQLAGVLGHEAGHVIGRHAAEHLAKQQLGRSLVTAVGVAASDERGGGQQAALIAQAVNQVVSLRYGRSDELESDRLGFRFMTEAGYDPRGIVELMQILGAARNGEAAPEFLSSHPNPENRVQKLQALIAQNYPNGVPANLVSGRDEFAKNVSGG
ncbi:M48 family metalloprotease [Tychonema sp. LEGE 07199]|uniref:M48 family metalloprotease n=1 Tax=unclassified Tychonema TaxID=2642144 RepID=UPI00187ED749|nr:M48 family metalloprotease [Tychonema sp. LEGE 07199]MBE9134176.1 M48 family metalloprotease [Tychonema sp. LEGE 07196]